MINIIWALMAIIGILYAMVNDTISEVNKAIFDSANEAVMITIGLISVLVFWLGMMRIAEATKMLYYFSKLCRPVVEKLFPDIPKDHPAIGYILSNITANIFGLGNAATPMGIKAMKEMKKLHHSDEASRSMITFLALNTSGLTVIPTTVIAIRMQYGAASPTEIVGTTLIATIISTTSAIIFDRYFFYKERKK